MNALNMIVVGVGAFGLIGMASFGGKLLEDQRAAAVQKFAVTEAERPMMQACEDTLRREDIAFKSGVSEISGCACIAREVHDDIRSAESAFATALLPSLIVSHVKEGRSGERAAEAVGALIEQHGMSERRAEAVKIAIADAVGSCSEASRHRTPEEQAGFDRAEAEEAGRSRTAFDAAVEQGIMTREEADRRMAATRRSPHP